jgi:hypothetical protein
MDIQIGRLRVNLTPLVLYLVSEADEILAYEREIERPKLIYRWDCRSQTGRPDPRLQGIREEPKLNILIMDFREFHYSTALGDEYLRFLVAKAGLADPRAFDAAFVQALPPLTAAIDYSELIDPIASKYSVDLTARVRFTKFLGRPAAGSPSDHFFVFVPESVTFTSVVTGRCGGEAEDGRHVVRRSVRNENEVIERLDEETQELLRLAHDDHENLMPLGIMPPEEDAPPDETDTGGGG